MALKSEDIVPGMESSLSWIHTAPEGVRISFLQGFFESAGEIDDSTMTLVAPVLPSFVEDILRLLVELGVRAAVVGIDPPTIALDLRVVRTFPLLSPVIKDGKYYDVQAALSRPRIETTDG